ncbi:hypothetical protein L249_1165 [Ophiocordyceps polyrhachis-furcata BCC 54312]|uniref:Ribosomal protein bL31m N-terminal domain-containing protein n=1 Tax=Ophiocordyceps polyrhachis-furcata BCC 54312 TaxID=1330021 RepID=A0A367LE17_9HYPO|nr:hypothetical protein L249_1165 [Ophiocordyceps polyrhachis-furcata BCC 54312]
MASIRWEQTRLRPNSLIASLVSSSTLQTTRPRSPLLQQTRNATFIQRPRRPYIFTQMVQLTDGSTYTVRTTTPNPLYRPVKDTRNTLTWQPSEKTLHNIELDEAGKLAGFRDRYGRSFDIAFNKSKEGPQIQDTNDFSDLITKYVSKDAAASMKSPLKQASSKKK